MQGHIKDFVNIAVYESELLKEYLFPNDYSNKCLWNINNIIYKVTPKKLDTLPSMDCGCQKCVFSYPMRVTADIIFSILCGIYKYLIICSTFEILVLFLNKNILSLCYLLIYGTCNCILN